MGELRTCEDTYATIKAGSIQEGADVFADAGADADVEAAVGRNIEILSASIRGLAIAAIELHDAVTSDDLHALGFGSAKVEITGIDEAQGFLAAIRKQHTVADDFTVKIDVRFGDGCDSGKFGGDG